MAIRYQECMMCSSKVWGWFFLHMNWWTPDIFCPKEYRIHNPRAFKTAKLDPYKRFFRREILMERPEIHGLVSLEINPSIGGSVIMMFFFPFGGICDRSLEAIFWARASPEENSEIDFQRKGNRPFNSGKLGPDLWWKRPFLREMVI